MDRMDDPTNIYNRYDPVRQIQYISINCSNREDLQNGKEKMPRDTMTEFSETSKTHESSH